LNREGKGKTCKEVQAARLEIEIGSEQPIRFKRWRRVSIKE
jgi:hypothetical protein